MHQTTEPEKLKSRLIKRFGDETGCLHPRHRSESEIVFSDAIPKGQIIEENLTNLEIDKRGRSYNSKSV